MEISRVRFEKNFEIEPSLKMVVSAKGLSNCDSTHIPNYISARQSVCLSLSDLGFNILPVDSYFD